MSVIFKPTGTRVDYDDAESYLELNIANARAVLAALGLATPSHLCGATPSDSATARQELFELCASCTLPEARRGLLRARNSDLVPLERSSHCEYGSPRRADDGTIELRPLRMTSGGVDAHGLRLRIELFARLVQRATEIGAPGITWG
jgi:hypothetical protein